MEAFGPFILYVIAVAVVILIIYLKLKHDKQKIETTRSNYNDDLSSLKSSLSTYNFHNAKLIPDEDFFREKAAQYSGSTIWYHVPYIFIWDSSYTKFGVYDTKSKRTRVYQKCDLLDFSLYKNGTMVPQGSIGSVILGGAVFGTVGAIAGAAKAASSSELCTDLTIEIILRNNSEPRVSLPLLNKYSSPTDLDYRKKTQMARDILAVLRNIKES